VGIWVVIVLFYIFRAAFWMAAHRAMLNYIQEAGRVAYTNTYMVGMSMAMGLTAIVAGLVIQAGGLWGFRVCFGLSCLSGLCGALMSRRVVKDGDPLDRSLTRLINPVAPLRTLARIAWITVGMHESNRS